MTIPAFFILAIGFLLSGCSDNQNKIADSTPYIERSQKLTQELKQSLAGELKQALQAGGPVGAIEVCQRVAQTLTQEVSDWPEGPRIRRTALRTRNPANQPDPDSIAVIKKWQSKLSVGEPLPEAHVRQSNDSVIVHLPIRTGQLCLECHGNPANFTDELNQKLAEYYPEDEATGFQLGDIRGAFRIDFPK